jgi:outer membrane receptor protein involved in Fe transport
MLMLIFLSFLFSGTAGKINGTVYDAISKEPLVGCNIMITGTSLGTATDIDGQFFLMDIYPGSYTIKASMIGYSDYVINDIEVNIDLTTKLVFPMTVSAIEGETVVVDAKKDLINKNLTSTTAIIRSEDIAKLPVNEISEAINLQAGFVDGHLRGGRTGEIAYWVDGIPVTDQYDGNTVIDISKDMVQEMQLISGAFNAEYGQAMSGIINITTKEGDENFGGSLNIYSGDFLSSKNNLFINLDSFNPITTQNIALNLHGKILPKLYYYLNFRSIYYQGPYQGYRRYNPSSYGVTMDNSEGEEIWHIVGSDDNIDSLLNLQIMDQYLLDTTDDQLVSDNYDALKNAHSNPLGDGSYVPMDWNKKQYFQVNTIWKISQSTKLKLSAINDNVNYQDYDRMYKYNPDGNLLRERFGLTTLIQLKHSINQNSFFNLGITNFEKRYNHTASDIYVHDIMNSVPDGYSFYVGGSNNSQFERSTNTQTIKFDYTNQINSINMLKLGVELRRHKVAFEDIYLQPSESMTTIDPIYESSLLVDPQVLDVSTIYHSKYEFDPIEYSGYLQNKIELSELIMNLGIRFDYFNSNGRVLSDPSDPSIYNPIRPENRNATIDERSSYWYKDASGKVMLSPRFGASFPFSDQGVIHFSYGHFFQIPQFELLYHNSDFDLGQGTGNVGYIGNADLDPEKTISYELGFKYQPSPYMVLDATFYCRDIRDLTGTRSDEISMFGGASTYSKYENSDFAFVKGLVLSLNYFSTDGLSSNINYTIQQAKGTASSPSQAWNAAQGGSIAETYMIPLDWDQLHTLSTILSYSKNNYGISLIGKIGSGLPYTPLSSTNISSLIQNSDKKPLTSTFDLKSYYIFSIGSVGLQVYFNIFNLFDKLNQSSVYNDSGVANYTTYKQTAINQNTGEHVNTIQEWFDNETYYSNPRRIEIGVKYDF